MDNATNSLKEMKKTSTQILLVILIQMFACSPNPEALNKQASELLDQHKFEQAFPILVKASNLGNAEAQYSLGLLYRDCCSVTGMKPNYDKSIMWIGKAANQGHTKAIETLMKSYRYGDFVPRNLEKAFHYGLLCAKKGNVECMQAVYGFYADGSGVAQDSEQMLAWGTKIGLLNCEVQNHVTATDIMNIRLDLAKKYSYGYRLEKDLLKSYQWFLLYNENKIFQADYMQEAYMELIQEVEEKLSSKQKKEAIIQAETLLGSPLKNVENLYIVER